MNYTYFMKKIKSNILVLSLLLLGAMGAFQPTVFSMDGGGAAAAGSAHEVDDVTKQILFIVGTYLTEKNIKATALLKDDAKESTIRNAEILGRILHKADKDFVNVPGYRALKEKILKNLQSLRGSVDQERSRMALALNECKEKLAKFQAEIDKISKVEIDKISDFKIFQKIPFLSSEYGKWITKQYPFNKEDKDHPNKQKSAEVAKLLTLKQNYLEALGKCAKLDEAVAATYQDDRFGLTLLNAKTFIEEAEKRRVEAKRKSKGKVQDKALAQPKDIDFNSYSHTLEGTLYELEAALVAQDHGE